MLWLLICISCISLVHPQTSCPEKKDIPIKDRIEEAQLVLYGKEITSPGRCPAGTSCGRRQVVFEVHCVLKNNIEAPIPGNITIGDDVPINICHATTFAFNERGRYYILLVRYQGGDNTFFWDEVGGHSAKLLYSELSNDTLSDLCGLGPIMAPTPDVQCPSQLSAVVPEKSCDVIRLSYSMDVGLELGTLCCTHMSAQPVSGSIEAHHMYAARIPTYGLSAPPTVKLGALTQGEKAAVLLVKADAFDANSYDTTSVYWLEAGIPVLEDNTMDLEYENRITFQSYKIPYPADHRGSGYTLVVWRHPMEPSGTMISTFTQKWRNMQQSGESKTLEELIEGLNLEDMAKMKIQVDADQFASYNLYFNEGVNAATACRISNPTIKTTGPYAYCEVPEQWKSTAPSISSMNLVLIFFVTIGASYSIS